MQRTTMCLLLSIWLLGDCSSVVSAQTVSSGSLVQFVSATTVSDRFQHETKAATKSIPPRVWKTLLDAGWQVQLAEFVVDAAPSLRGVRPPGWPRHLTWDNSDAIHLPTDRLLVIAEKRRNRAGDVVASSRVGGVLRHEIGHAFDMAAGGGSGQVSSSSDFMRVYQRDVSRITARNKSGFSYYLQSGAVGRQEAFAEAFAMALGGGSSEIEASQFESSFPNVMAYTRQVIKEPAVAATVPQPGRIGSDAVYRRRWLRRR